MKMNDLDGCVVTFEQTQEKLESIERQLGAKLGVAKGVRRTLLALAMEGELEDGELAADWQQAYASYLDWMAEEAEDWPDHEVIGDSPPPATSEGEKPNAGAADAASALLWVGDRRTSNTLRRDGTRPETEAISASLLSRVDPCN